MCTISAAFLEDVNKAADILKAAGCQECYIFGSVAEGRSNNKSDIDLAVRGLAPDKFFFVYGQLSRQIKRQIDLIDLDDGSRFSQKLLRREAMKRVF